ncbi:2-amino-1-hydroxyethylphosphonate dioxygenase (glycine-forming)-like [Haliotis rubra]|uniref:2-amino-1-hydroxyethylphosphonate dioxygenase (glycine-forming)-like n=1 Tax=Haliotis rubra TaxID=36100 RepID=UPI001EE5B669|nr:2-amino-1-hydroxyethylphosphonate dioxygenase (glycine-forming)-like [Haliotis rubra]
MCTMDPGVVTERLFQLYRDHGSEDYLGEDVSKTQHSIQCGMLAEAEGCSKEIVLGAFLHDIGHLVGQEQQLPKMVTNDVNLGAANHDTVGAKFLQDLGFPEVVCDLVGGHVKAKRYLVWKYPDYYEKLTPASKKTLQHQGGPMNSDEAASFETSPLHQIILRMRTWDERAKDPETKMDSVDKFKNLCMEVLKAKY